MAFRLTINYLGSDDHPKPDMNFGKPTHGTPINGGIHYADMTRTFEENLATLVHTFRLFDDDGELYFEGMSSSSDDESAFEPLDWAMNRYGATTIKYLRNGKWETL